MKKFLEKLIKKITKKNLKYAGHMSIAILYLLFFLTVLISTIFGTSLILYFKLLRKIKINNTMNLIFTFFLTASITSLESVN